MKEVSRLMENIEEDILSKVEEKEVTATQREAIKLKVWEEINAEARISILPNSQTKKKSTGKRSIYKKLFLVAIIGATLFGSVVGAISVSETLQQLFGDKVSLIVPQAQNIQQSTSNNGVTLTLDTAVVDNLGGLIIFNFTKDDGTTFDEDTTVRYMGTEFEVPTSSSYGKNYRLSDDGKQLTYILQLFASEGIVDGSITTKFSDLVIATPSEYVTDISLAELHEKMAINVGEDIENPDEEGVAQIFKAENHAKEVIRQPLNHPYMETEIIGVGFRGADFFIELEHLEAEEYHGKLFKVVDTRTGEEMETNSEEFSSTEVEDTERHLENKKIYYQGIREKDLQHLKVINVYDEYEYMAEGEWELTFEIQQNKQVKKSRRPVVVIYEDEEITVDSVEISSLGGVIEGTVVNKNTGEQYFAPDLKIPMKVVLDDRTKIPYRHSMSSGDGDGFRMILEQETAFDEEKTYVDLLSDRIVDIDRVRGIEIGGKYIPLK